MSEPAMILDLDVSHLAPPEPLERILDALASLQAGGYLRVLHRREPFPLYDLLRRMGYVWRTQGGDDRFEILIWSAETPPAPADLDGRRPC